MVLYEFREIYEAEKYTSAISRFVWFEDIENVRMGNGESVKEKNNSRDTVNVEFWESRKVERLLDFLLFDQKPFNDFLRYFIPLKITNKRDNSALLGHDNEKTVGSWWQHNKQ